MLSRIRDGIGAVREIAIFAVIFFIIVFPEHRPWLGRQVGLPELFGVPLSEIKQIKKSTIDASSQIDDVNLRLNEIVSSMKKTGKDIEFSGGTTLLSELENLVSVSENINKETADIAVKLSREAQNRSSNTERTTSLEGWVGLGSQIDNSWQEGRPHTVEESNLPINIGDVLTISRRVHVRDDIPPSKRWHSEAPSLAVLSPGARIKVSEVNCSSLLKGGCYVWVKAVVLDQ